MEAKGRWDVADRRKHKLIQEQQPDLDIRFVFQRANSKIRKGSKTSYARYAEKLGIPWAQGRIPKEWLLE